MNYELTAPSKELCQLLAEDMRTHESLLPIEEICHVLYTEYTYEELHVMEAEFLLQHILKYFPELETDEVDSLFINKLYAIPAILKQPKLLVSSLTAFYNTIMVCNDLPAGYSDSEDIKPVPVRYITRMFLAVNDMLPEDMDFEEMYLHPNIRRYIFKCYELEDLFILDLPIRYLQGIFLEGTYTVSRAKELGYLSKDLNQVLLEIRKTVNSAVTGLVDQNTEDDAKVYPLLRKKDTSIQDIKVRLYKYGYYKQEASIMKMYEDDPYVLRAISSYLSNMFYAFAYKILTRNMKSRSFAVILDGRVFDTLKESDLTHERIAAMSEGLFRSEGQHRVVYYTTEKDSSFFNRLIDSIDEDIEFTATEVVKEDLGAVYLKDLLATVFDVYGPPGATLLLSSSERIREEAINPGYLRNTYPGWDVRVLS